MLANIQKLVLFLEGKNKLISRELISYINPIIFLGNNLNKYGLNTNTLLTFFKKIAPTSIVINNVLACNSQGLNFYNIKNVTKLNYLNSDMIICLNLDNNFILANSLQQSKAKIIWANTHGSILALKSDIIIPLLSEFEEEKIFINLEERPQKSLKTFSGINNSRSLETLLKLLLSNKSLQVNSTFLNFINELILSPQLFLKYENIFSKNLNIKSLNFKSLLSTQLVKPVYTDFYNANKATKISLIMSKCSQEMRKSISNFI